MTLYGPGPFRAPHGLPRKPIKGGRYKIRRVAMFDVKPWRAWTDSVHSYPKTKRFTTHSQAILWATEQVKTNTSVNKIGSKWEEINRPGHTVEITKLSVNRWTGQHEVSYKHVGIHNVRAQQSQTLSDKVGFLKRYKVCGD